MKTQHILAMVFLLLAASATFAQPSRAMSAAANQSWPSFWRQITTAINKKDHVALRKMMANNFTDVSGGLNAKEWLKLIDENERNGSWKDLQKSFAQGTKTSKEWSAKGIPTRVTKDDGYYFEFRKDKKWYFAGVVGD
jgi:hypothetical protein